MTSGDGLEVARTAAAHWAFGADAVVSELCVSENATYRVREPGRPDAVLRLHRPGYHSYGEIASELAWSQALRNDEIPTPGVWPTTEGGLIATLSAPTGTRPGTYATLFDFVPGAAPEPGDPVGGMRAMGALAARLHGHSLRWRSPAGFTRFRWDLSAALGTPDGPGRWGSWPDAARHLPRPERTVLTRAERRVRTTLTAYATAPDRFGLIHADLRAANLLVDRGSERVTVLDFDDCGFSWFGYDLAASVSFVEHTPELAELVAEWLAGYRHETGRTQPHADSMSGAPLDALIMLRRLQLLAWAGSHAETRMVASLGPDFAAESAAVADRYLSGRLLPGQLR